MHSVFHKTLVAVSSLVLMTGFSLADTIPEDAIQKQIDERRASGKPRSDADKKMTQEMFDKIIQSHILDNVLKTGDKAIDFTLPNAVEKPVTLSELLDEGPVILTWYRGGWCPFCNIQLATYQKYLDEFEKRSAQLVAISPDLPDNVLSTQEKLAIKFHILSDLNNKVGKQYGLIYELTPALAKRMENLLRKYTGSATAELPLAVTYIVDKKGVIRYDFITHDYARRAEPADLIKALDSL